MFRYADVDRVLDDPGTFSSNLRLSSMDFPSEEECSPTAETMLLADGDRHERLRGVVEDWCRARAADRDSGTFRQSLPAPLRGGRGMTANPETVIDRSSAVMVDSSTSAIRLS